MDYQNMTVADLKAEADSRDLDYASDAKKDELIALLKKDDKNGAKGKSGEPAPEQQEEEPPVDPYVDFADPVIDGSKPILNHITPSDPVQVIVMDGSNLRPAPEGDLEDYDHLVFVQSGASQEFLTSENAKRKFVQDKEGQIFYYSHGVAATNDLKVVDVVALGT